MLRLTAFAAGETQQGERIPAETINSAWTEKLFDVLGVDNHISAENEAVSRGDFLATLMSVLNSEISDGESSGFEDVKGDLAGVVQTAAEKKIITRGGSFRPDDAVTYAEALKMCLVSAGYEYECAKSGGWPHGVIAVAEKYDLGDNIKKTANDALSAEEAMILFYNFLNTEVAQIDGVRDFGNDVKLHFAKERQTVLSVYHGVESVTGIVTENSRSSLYKAKQEQQSSVKINYKTYLCNEDTEDLLGYNVQAYISEDGDRIIAAFPKKTYICRLDGEDAVGIRNGYLIFESDHGKVSFELSGEYDVIFNNKVYSGSMTEEFLSCCDSITLIDNDNDGVYEIVKADDILYILTEKVNYVDKAIYTRSETGGSIDLSPKRGKYLILNENNEKINLYDIKPDMFIEAVVSEDGLYARISVHEKTINGTVTAMDLGNNIIEISGESYSVTNEFAAAFPNLKVGERGNFHIASNGKIALYEKSSSDFHYGYIIKMDKERSLGDYKIKMLCESGSIKIFDVERKLTVDGDKKNDEDLFKLQKDSGFIRLVRYKTNAESKINAVDTASYDERTGETAIGTLNTDTVRENDNLTIYDFAEDTTYTSYLYKTEAKSLFPKVNLSLTKVFAVPDSGEDTSDDTKYIVGGGDLFTNDQQIPRNKVKLFDIDETGNCGALLYFGDAMRTEFNSSSFYSAVVEKVKNEVDPSDDNYRTKLSLIADGKYEELFVSDDVDLEALKTSGRQLCGGDIIRYKSDGKKILDIVVDFDSSADVMKKNNSSFTASFNGQNAAYQYQSGKIYSMDSQTGYFTPEADGDEPFPQRKYNFSWQTLKNHQIPQNKIVKVVVHYTMNGETLRERSREVSIADASEVETYLDKGEDADYAVLRQNALAARLLVVYKFVF